VYRTGYFRMGSCFSAILLGAPAPFAEPPAPFGAPPYGFAPNGLYATAEGSVGTAGAIDSEKESSALVLLEAAGATGANAGGCVGAGSAFELKTSSLLVGLGVPKSS